jgi:hypothetical protein
MLLDQVSTYMGEPAIFVMIDGKGVSIIRDRLVDEVFFITGHLNVKLSSKIH